VRRTSLQTVTGSDMVATSAAGAMLVLSCGWSIRRSLPPFEIPRVLSSWSTASCSLIWQAIRTAPMTAHLSSSERDECIEMQGAATDTGRGHSDICDSEQIPCWRRVFA
jgi:hypothetical protein